MSWRERLYEQYVGSGQAAGAGGEVTFEQSSIAARSEGIRKTIRRFIPRRRDLRIVDLGCGHGDFVYHLTQLGYENVEGVDVSTEQVQLARRLGVENVVCDDIESYLSAQSTGSVDIVLLIDVIEHFKRQELFDLMDEVVRVLDSGGQCLVHVPNALGLFGMRVRYGDLTHELAFTPNTIRQLFQTVGLSEVECHEDPPGGRFRTRLWTWAILPVRALLWMEKPDEQSILSQNMYATAVKK